MKNLIVSLIFVLTSIVSFSQTKIDSNLFLKGKDSLLLIDVLIKDLYLLDTPTNTTNFDSLLLLNPKRLKNKSFHYSFSISYLDVFYWDISTKKLRTVINSELFYITGFGVKDKLAYIYFSYNKNKLMKINLIEISENTFGVVLTVTKNGNTKTYFSKTCEIEKQLN
jgi:hypothetical protein